MTTKIFRKRIIWDELCFRLLGGDISSPDHTHLVSFQSEWPDGTKMTSKVISCVPTQLRAVYENTVGDFKIRKMALDSLEPDIEKVVKGLATKSK